MDKNVSKLFKDLKGLGKYTYEHEDMQYIDINIQTIIKIMQSNNFDLETIKSDICQLLSTEDMYDWNDNYPHFTEEQYKLMINTKYDTILLFSNDSIESNRQILIVTLITDGERYDVSLAGVFYLDNTQTILFFTKDGWMDENTTAPTIEQSNNTNNNEDLESRVNNLEDKLDTLIKMLAK